MSRQPGFASLTSAVGQNAHFQRKTPQGCKDARMQGCKDAKSLGVLISSFTVPVLVRPSDIAKTLIVISELAAIHIPIAPLRSLRPCTFPAGNVQAHGSGRSKSAADRSLIATPPTDIAIPFLRPVHSIQSPTLGEGLTMSEQSTALG